MKNNAIEAISLKKICVSTFSCMKKNDRLPTKYFLIFWTIFKFTNEIESLPFKDIQSQKLDNTNCFCTHQTSEN